MHGLALLMISCGQLFISLDFAHLGPNEELNKQMALHEAELHRALLNQDGRGVW